MTILSINKLRSGYGKIEVLHDVDVTIERGQILTLIGANGAGKTTLLKTISGLIRPTAGTIDSTDGASPVGRRIRSSGSASVRCRKAAPSSNA